MFTFLLYTRTLICKLGFFSKNSCLNLLKLTRETVPNHRLFRTVPLSYRFSYQNLISHLNLPAHRLLFFHHFPKHLRGFRTAGLIKIMDSSKSGRNDSPRQAVSHTCQLYLPRNLLPDIFQIRSRPNRNVIRCTCLLYTSRCV